MDITAIETILKNEPTYRIKQIKKVIFVDLVTSWKQATTLPQNLRNALQNKCPLEINAEVFPSKDTTSRKALITLSDGNKIETVLMRHKGRNSVCVSSQVGCPLGCIFCATGALGFIRNLTSDEIIEQVILWARLLKKEKQKVTNIVYMGMGEPLLNYDNVLKSIDILNDQEGLRLGARRFSISTSGIVEGILKLAKQPLEINLALSLHSPTDELRSKLMPINKRYSLKELIPAIRQYIQMTKRRVMIEYILIKDINDSPVLAHSLAQLLKGMLCFVNLIPCNPVGDFRPSSREVILRFRSILEKSGLTVVQRYTFGQDIHAACGQLAGKDIVE